MDDRWTSMNRGFRHFSSVCDRELNIISLLKLRLSQQDNRFGRIIAEIISSTSLANQSSGNLQQSLFKLKKTVSSLLKTDDPIPSKSSKDKASKLKECSVILVRLTPEEIAKWTPTNCTESPSSLKESSIPGRIDKLRHKVLSSQAKQPFKCNGCNKRFKTLANLKLHCRVGCRAYVCQECNAGFTQPHKLKEHRLLHREPRWYSCSICEQQFESVELRKAHFVHHLF